MNKYFLILTIFLLSVIPIKHASALTVSPARIEISGARGETITKEITLFNENKISSQKLYVSFANFEANGESGTPKFITPTDGIGTWMSPPKDILLKPNETKNISVSIKIPDTADGGGHFGAVFFGTAPESKGQGQVAISAKTGVLVLLSVAGDVTEAGGLISFNTKSKKFFYTTLPVDFEYRFRNDGNDRVKPKGTITIRNGVFYPTERLDANASLGNVLPNSTRLFQLSWGQGLSPSSINSFFDAVRFEWKNFAFGPYFARLSLSYGSNMQASSQPLFFVVIPWHLIIVVLVIIFFLLVGGKKLLRSYNDHIIKKAREKSL